MQRRSLDLNTLFTSVFFYIFKDLILKNYGSFKSLTRLSALKYLSYYNLDSLDVFLAMFLLGFMASFLLAVLLYVIQNYVKIFYLNTLSLGYFKVNITLFM